MNHEHITSKHPKPKHTGRYIDATQEAVREVLAAHGNASMTLATAREEMENAQRKLVDSLIEARAFDCFTVNMRRVHKVFGN